MTRLIFIGGFLGSGKTTLIYEISRILKYRGLLSGIITNDQYDSEKVAGLSKSLTKNFPECKIVTLSSKTGEGLEGWLDMALNIDISGRNILEVDYERYAEGEAVLGWLNCSASLTGRNVDRDKFAASLMNEMADRFKALRVSTGHVKLIVENGDLYISANLAGSSEKPVFRWSAGKSDNAEMIVNARVVMEPEELEKVFRNSLQIVTNFDIKVKINRIRSIKPGYPNPTHRYTSKTK